MPRVQYTKQAKLNVMILNVGHQRNCVVGRKNPKKQSVRLYHRITSFEK